MLKTIDTDIWAIESEVKLPLGIRMPVRSTILRLSDGSLMVISPVKTTDDAIDEVRKLGPVRYIVAPNCMHHLFIKKFATHFPTAEIWGPHCLQDKRNDIHFKGTLSDKETMPWESDVDMIMVKAKAPMVEEAIFFHRKAKTVVITDLLFNFQKFDRWGDMVLAKLNGGYKKLTMTRVGKTVFTDKRSLHTAASHILSWNPKNLVVGHGDVILNTAATALKEPLSAFAAINS